MSRKAIHTILLLSSLSLLSCSSQMMMKYKNQKKGNTIERLNVNKLERQKNAETQTKKVIVSSFMNKYYRYDYFNKINNRSYVINKGSGSYGYTKSECYYDDYFGVPCIMAEVSLYDINGILKYKGKYVKEIVPEKNYKKAKLEGIFIIEQGALKIGIWNEYNTDGLITKTTNYDNGFEFNFKNVFDYMIKSNADIYPNSYFKRIRIDRDYEKKIWTVRFNITGSNERFFIQINGKTGEVLLEQKSVTKPYF